MTPGLAVRALKTSGMGRKDEGGAGPSLVYGKIAGKTAALARLAIANASAGLASVGALAIGATAIGALSVGALAIGALAVGRFRLRDGHVTRLEIDELIVRRLTVLEGPNPQV
jgi:hypothetical protein